MNELGDKVSADEKTAIEAKVNEVKEALKGTDVEAIKAATEALQQEVFKMSEKVYQAAQQAQGAADAAGAAQPEGNVYDADFKDVNDEQK